MAGWQGAVRRLQGQINALRGGITGTGGGLPVALELGPSPSVSRPNGVASLLLCKPAAGYPNTSAITIKREDDNWADGSPYGSGQALVVLSPSGQDANNLAGDGSLAGENPVLARLDAYGGLGLSNGLHVAPGLRDNHRGPNPIGIWVQRFIDAYGVWTSAPDPAVVPNPAQPHFMAAKYDQTPLAGINAKGQIVAYADDGTTSVATLAPGNVGAAGFRGILYTYSANIGGLGIRPAGGQTADLLVATDSTGTVPQGGIGKDGRLQTYADDGTTVVAATYPTDLGNSGFRQILLTKNKNTGGLAIKIAAAQVADAIQVVDSIGGTHTIVDAAARIRATLGVTGVSPPSNTSTPAGWFSAVVTATGVTVKIPIYA